MRRIRSIINTANGLCSLQRQIFEIVKTCFNILQLQSGNTLPRVALGAQWVEGRRAEMEGGTDALVSRTLIMTFRAVFIASIYSGLPMILSAALARQKNTRRFPPRNINPGKLFLCRSFDITRQREFTFYSDISLA